MTFFNSRGQHAKAVQVGNNLLQSPSVQFTHVETALFYEGWAYFQRHQDKDYSLTDCLSFLVMQKLDIQRAFAFDQHFVQAGFTKSRRASCRGLAEQGCAADCQKPPLLRRCGFHQRLTPRVGVRRTARVDGVERC